MLRGIALSAVHSPTVPSLEHDLFSLATLGMEACDAVGDAFRPQWRERPAKEFRRISSQRHPRECRRLRRLHSFRFARLNVVAGATDASRAMLLTPCCKVELLTAIF